MNKKKLEKADKIFRDFIVNHSQTNRLISLTARSIFQFSKSYNLVAALADYERFNGEEVDNNALKEEKDDADFAQTEVEKGLPILYGQGSIWMWGYLEAFIEDLTVFCLDNDPSLMSIDNVKKIKVPIAQYDALSPKERKYFLLETLERDLQSAFKQGISRFENLLSIFGLGGEVDETIKKDLLELSSIRNVLVHRRGLVDRRLVECCKWLNLSVGETVQVKSVDFNKYSLAIAVYAGIVYRRVVIHFRGDTKRIDEFINSLATKKSNKQVRKTRSS
jgi:hypothetical protein